METGCWIKAAPNSAVSICYYTFTTGTLLRSLLTLPCRNFRSFSGNAEAGFTWQPVSRIWRKLKTKDMLQVVKSFILSKMSSMISLWRHSQAATPSKYSSLPEGFVVVQQCCVGLVLCREKIWIFFKEFDLSRTHQWCAGISPLWRTEGVTKFCCSVRWHLPNTGNMLFKKPIFSTSEISWHQGYLVFCNGYTESDPTWTWVLTGEWEILKKLH